MSEKQPVDMSNVKAIVRRFGTYLKVREADHSNEHTRINHRTETYLALLRVIHKASQADREAVFYELHVDSHEPYARVLSQYVSLVDAVTKHIK